MGRADLRFTQPAGVAREKRIDKGYFLGYNTPCRYLKRTISSAGMSIRLTCGGSQVQVLYRPPGKTAHTVSVCAVLLLWL